MNHASTEDILEMMQSLDSTNRGLGMHDKALEMQESALTMRRRILPEDHPYIAESMNNLGL